MFDYVCIPRLSLCKSKHFENTSLVLHIPFCLCDVASKISSVDVSLNTRQTLSMLMIKQNLDTGFSWFPCVYKQMLRWFPRFQVATTCFSCSPPDLNLLVTNFMSCIHVK